MCTHLILLNLVREIGFDRWVSIAYAEWFRKVVLDKWILSSLIKDRLNPILRILQIHIIKVWYTHRKNWKLPDPFNQVSSCIRYPSNESYPYLRFRITFYYIDKSVLVENRPLVKFMRNYTGDLSSVFFYSPPPSLVRISMTSFPAQENVNTEKKTVWSKIIQGIPWQWRRKERTSGNSCRWSNSATVCVGRRIMENTKGFLEEVFAECPPVPSVERMHVFPSKRQRILCAPRYL